MNVGVQNRKAATWSGCGFFLNHHFQIALRHGPQVRLTLSTRGKRPKGDLRRREGLRARPVPAIVPIRQLRNFLLRQQKPFGQIWIRLIAIKEFVVRLAEHEVVRHEVARIGQACGAGNLAQGAHRIAMETRDTVALITYMGLRGNLCNITR